MRIRKSFSRMSDPERTAFLSALLRMKNEIANPGDLVNPPISIYDQFVALHNAVRAVRHGAVGPNDRAHQGPAFGPWHRELLIRFERELQNFDPTVMLPYWDWTDATGNAAIIFNEFGMGPDGDPTDTDRVKTGYFSYNAPGTGAGADLNTTPSPAWWPAGMLGWRLDSRLVFSPISDTWLNRNLDSFASLGTASHVRTTLDTPVIPPATDEATYNAFRGQLEGGTRMHNHHHNWFGVGAHMRDPSQSPNDPMFFLHHCNCDRLWAMWQMDGHEGSTFYSQAGSTTEGHNLPDAMWPWIGAAAGYSSDNLAADVVLPNFSAEPARTAVDVMDHRNITLNGVDVSYAYDSQVVVGVALDRTGSMQGLTPDPLTGMPPNISKLDAAKQGVAAFLQDAEAAYQAGEAYVVAGVEVFRNNAGANEVVPVSPATPPYGLVKSGSPYGRAQFQLDVAAVTASGGTPLAAALTETEDEMVRLPFANRPPNEQRYLCILTDGKETSPPLLSTLGTPEFPDTMIFALGFGIGSGWDGVDYATIDSLKSKGKLAPVGVEQAFHGENAGIIDKFYTNSIAHTLGFAAIVDPMFELFPGEEVMVPFVATDTDQAFMITAQGFDYQDRNWSFHLMGPDGVMYHDHGAPMTDPLIITTVRNQARLTLFLNRGTATPAQWVGTWNVMAVYMPKAKDRQMMMPSDWELLVPIGAPPLRGPLYTRFDQPISKRRAVRQQRPIKGAPLLQASGVNTTEPGNPCTVGINIYGRGVTTARVEIRTRERFAGNSIDVIVRLEDLAGGRLARANVVGRLVAPAFSLGNLFADLKTIKRSARRKYLLKRDGREVFDELQFLADYENAKPGALALRDEPLRFERRDDDSFVARIGATRHPGVYRVAVRVEGAVARAKCNDPVFRIVNAAVALGVKPDPGHSKPTLHWLAPDRFVVTFTPTDALGNKAWLSNAAPPVLLFRRQPLVAEFRDLYDGNYQLEVTLGGKPVVTADGCHCRGARFTVTNGADITMQAGQLLRLTLRIGQSVIPVLLPTALAGPKGKPIPAGSPAAMKIPVDRRVVLSYREPPAGIGGSGAPGDAPSEHDAGNDHHH